MGVKAAKLGHMKINKQAPADVIHADAVEIRYETKPNFLNWLLRQNVGKLSEALGCDRQLIYFWRSGHCKPSLQYLPKLLDYSNQHIDVLSLLSKDQAKELRKNIKKA